MTEQEKSDAEEKARQQENNDRLTKEGVESIQKRLEELRKCWDTYAEGLTQLNKMIGFCHEVITTIELQGCFAAEGKLNELNTLLNGFNDWAAKGKES